ncbi:MAG: hypothetical protein BM558_05000 [Roseobacter sp. MedPE-SW]|nr:MAG: hypothetical protein BM558_05000 [Roseobacter sp. MedPE-SW]
MPNQAELEAGFAEFQAGRRSAWTTAAKTIVSDAIGTKPVVVQTSVLTVLIASEERREGAFFPLPVADSPAIGGLADFVDLSLISHTEVRRLAGLVEIGLQKKGGAIARLVNRASEIGHLALTEGDLEVRELSALQLSHGTADMLLALVLQTEDRAVHAALNQLSPNAVHLILRSPGVSLLRADHSLTDVSADRLARLADIIAGVGSALNQDLDLEALAAFWGEEDRTIRMASHGAALLDEAVAFGQFDIAWAMGYGLAQLSDEIRDVMHQVMGNNSKWADRLDNAESPEAWSEAVDLIAMEQFSGYQSEELAFGSLTLRAGLSHGFASPDRMSPGRNAILEAGIAAGVSPNVIRNRLGDLGALNFGAGGPKLMDGGSGFPPPTDRELKVRRVFNAANFADDVATMTMNYAVDMVDDVAVGAGVGFIIGGPPGAALGAAGMAVWGAAGLAQDLVPVAKEHRATNREIILDQAIRDAYDSADDPKDSPADPPPPDDAGNDKLPGGAPGKAPDAKKPVGKPDAGGKQDGGQGGAQDNEAEPLILIAELADIQTEVGRAIDPEFLAKDTTPVSVLMARLQSAFLANITLPRSHYEGGALGWVPAELMQRKIALAYMALIYPPRPDDDAPAPGLPAGGNQDAKPDPLADGVTDPPPPEVQ